MVELPITLPQDHTLFFILPNAGADIWIRKARSLRERNGMALVLSHPDYARDQRVADGYRELLETFQDDDTVWHALPREVAAWWRSVTSRRCVGMAAAGASRAPRRIGDASGSPGRADCARTV